MLRNIALTSAGLVVARVLLAGYGACASALVGAAMHLPAVSSAAFDPGDVKRSYLSPDTIPFPNDNRYTPAKALLGRILFQDPRLSGSFALACASCHNAGFAFGNGLARGIGEGLKPLKRRSPSIINSAWGVRFMWDGRAGSLEQQAIGPIVGATEMNLPLAQIAPRLEAIRGYQALFASAFPGHAISPGLVGEAIATYERTVVSGTAPFDRWIGGDTASIPAAAVRGFNLFNGRAGCAACHGGWTFTDDGFHDTGLPDADTGRGMLLPRVIKMQHAFKTPGLREVARRGPYMHDGSLPTLAAVVAHYSGGGLGRPSQSELIRRLDLSAADQADIVAFLETLTGSADQDAVPAMPR
jgi:cytochrome c peroxidase